MDIHSLSAKARIQIRKPPSEVFNAFADANQMSRFWFTRHDDGLKRGESVPWFLGDGAEAMSFDVRVKELESSNKLVIEWAGYDGNPTQVAWMFEKTEDGDTILTIEETGFTGSDDVIFERVF
jgi:uncharacterized protein YndB with AHSA1/START domain